MKHSSRGTAGDAHELKGKAALAKLEKLARAHWETLTKAQREELGGDPKEVANSITRLAAWVGADRQIRLQRPTVHDRRRRLQENPIAVEGIPVTTLPHLEPGGSAEDREKNGAMSPTAIVINLRPLDDRDSALRGFDSRDVPLLAKRIHELRVDLVRLGATLLLRRVLLKEWPDARTRESDTLSGLQWYELELLPRLSDLLRNTGSRQLPDTRRIVVKLLTYVERATGARRFVLVSDVLNWRAPRAKSDPWTPRLLERWMKEHCQET